MTNFERTDENSQLIVSHALSLSEDSIDFDDSDVDVSYVPACNLSSDSEDFSANFQNNEDLSNLESERYSEGASEISHSTINRGNQKTRKTKRNLGLQYITSSGKQIENRQCIPLTECKKKCQLKIKYDDQKKIFDEYWKLGIYDMRSAYICGLIELEPIKCRKTICKTPRRYSAKFFLKNCGSRFEVCKKCLLDTFGETRKFIDIVCDKLYKCPGATPEKDRRGTASKFHKTLPKETTDGIYKHINSFPAYTSHYSRRHSSKRYLSTGLNLSIMYELYSKEYTNPASIFKYSEIFKSLNLKFKQPSLDACNYCETIHQKMKLATENKVELLKQQKEHHALADLAYTAKNQDKEKCKQNSEISRMFTFDLQKCLPTPRLSTSVSFYKRSLWTFNLTVHDGASNQPFNYIWHEGIENRGEMKLPHVCIRI